MPNQRVRKKVCFPPPRKFSLVSMRLWNNIYKMRINFGCSLLDINSRIKTPKFKVQNLVSASSVPIECQHSIGVYLDANIGGTKLRRNIQEPRQEPTILSDNALLVMWRRCRKCVSSHCSSVNKQLHFGQCVTSSRSHSLPVFRRVNGIYLENLCSPFNEALLALLTWFVVTSDHTVAMPRLYLTDSNKSCLVEFQAVPTAPSRSGVYPRLQKHVCFCTCGPSVCLFSLTAALLVKFSWNGGKNLLKSPHKKPHLLATVPL